jgi:hypothetical protein
MSDFGQAKFRCLDNFIPSKYFVHGFKFFLSKSVREFVIVYSYCGHEAVLVCHTQFYSSLFTHTVDMRLSWYATSSSFFRLLTYLLCYSCQSCSGTGAFYHVLLRHFCQVYTIPLE